MNIFLDGKAVRADGWMVRSMAELVEQLQTLPELQERVIESIVVDGLEFHDWERNSAIELSGAAEIHVATKTVAQLLVSAVESAIEYLLKLQAGGIKAATLLQTGRETTAFGLIGQLVEGLQWYSEVLRNVAVLVPSEEAHASERLTTLGKIMEQLVEAWEAEDHTLLADLLEYELSPELREGLGYLRALSLYNSSDVENLE